MKYEIEIKQACEGFWSCISPDAWIQSIGGLIGTFLGAFIAAWISIRILKSQFNRENKKELENEYNMLMKFNEKYSRIVSPIIKNLLLIEVYLRDKDMESFKNLVEDNMKMAFALENIDTSSLSYIAEDKVNMLNRDIEMVMYQLLYYKKSGDDINIEGFPRNLKIISHRWDEYQYYEEMLKNKIAELK
ncbi:hypothetical protein ABH916_003452 [Peribacillus frigoritolerans]|uniref:hypothetical protein n=1 Tax=Peribacillus frigoritolerans TaxID=450367 RepID=UPI0038394D08